VTTWPRRRWPFAIQCHCGRVLLGSPRYGHRGWRKYRAHWREEHGKQQLSAREEWRQDRDHRV